jgi:hypothetical protein
MKYIFLLKLLPLIVVLIHSFCQAQSYKIQLGSSITAFSYTQANGIKADYLKPSSGSHFGISISQAILDTSKNLANTSKRSIYFSQHPTLAKILSAFQYDFGINYLQMNAVGDLQKIPFAYHTDFIGTQAGFGVVIPIKYGISISGVGQLTLSKMINGNQLISNQYFRLSDNPQFNALQFFTGYRGEISKKINDKTSVFIAYQKSQTAHSGKSGEATLNFAPTSFLIGLKFLK